MTILIVSVISVLTEVTPFTVRDVPGFLKSSTM